MDKERGEAKRRGQEAAKRWLQQATIEQKVALAGVQLEYGETLDDLIEENFEVPSSADKDFSYGFFKQVKGHVFHALSRRSPEQ